MVTEKDLQFSIILTTLCIVAAMMMLFWYVIKSCQNYTSEDNISFHDDRLDLSANRLNLTDSVRREARRGKKSQRRKDGDEDIAANIDRYLGDINRTERRSIVSNV